MRQVTLLVLACALSSAPTRANELIKVYELALQNDPQLAAASHARDAGVQAQPLARSALLPQLAGNYSISEQKDEIDTTIDGQPVHVERKAQPYTLSLNLSQAVFDWSAFKTYSQARESAALAEVSYRAAQQGLVLRSAQGYFNFLSAADNVRATRAENRAIERQLEQARRRFEVGLSAITDVQEAQARYDLTVATVIEAEQALSSAREILAEITGNAPVGLSSVQDDMPMPAPNPQNVGNWTDVALKENLELQAAQLNTRIAEKGVGVARGGYFPRVDVTGQKAEGESSGFNSGDYEQEKVTLNVNVPLFNGLNTKAALSQARSTRAQRRSEELGTLRRIERTTRDAYQAVLSNVSRVKAFRQAVLSSATALEASDVGLQVGARTSVDVLNAQQQLYSAQRNFSQARYGYLLSVLQLKAAAGRLTEADLAEIDRLLTACPPDPAQDSICGVGTATPPRIEEPAG